MNVIIIVMDIISITLSKSRLTYETASPEGGGVFPGASRALAPWCEQGSRPLVRAGLSPYPMVLLGLYLDKGYRR